MKTFTIEDIRNWKPCYDPSKYLLEGWSGTVVDVLKHDTAPAKDKLWVVLREEILDAKILRLFAVWCARQVEHLMTDERSKQALVVAEQYALGKATEEELAAARAAALAAAWDAADAAWDVAWAAARDAARAAALAAARDAADAAWDVAWAAARDAARAAAWDAARTAQVKQLLKMVEEAEQDGN